MGAGQSSADRQDVEDDELGLGSYAGPGVVQRIPIEVKPRGRLGLRTGGKSVSKPKGSSSLHSAMAFDIAENPEVEKVLKEFDMYRLNRENEVANMIKKEQKLETENKKLRAELQALQKMCKRQRDERDSALEAEHRALTRAAAIEADRDKIQRQFKIFRETKESELQNLLRAKRDLENKLAKLGAAFLEDSESSSRLDIGFSNLGDWWTATDSESLSGTSQVHSNYTATCRAPELMHELDGSVMTFNKDDWRAVMSSMFVDTHSSAVLLPLNVMRLFLSSASECINDVEKFLQEDCMSKLETKCVSAGKFFDVVHMSDIDDEFSTNHELCVQSRYWQIDRCSIFVAFIGSELSSYVKADVNYYNLKYSGKKPAVFYVSNTDKQQTGIDAMVTKLCETYDNVKLVIQSSGTEPVAADKITSVLEQLIEQLLLQNARSSDDNSLELVASDTPGSLFGSVVWDPYQDNEQLESLYYASQSSCQIGVEKYYEQLQAHVSAAGPLPPLLVYGGHGSGKSLLLAKWLIQLQHVKAPNCVVLYHFVGSSVSSSADPTLMIRRLTYQLMNYVTCPPGLTSDPVRLVADFPKWLEKVSSRFPGGIILVIDSADNFQKCESLLSWLADPLPVDLRVILTVRPEFCPQSWKSWPSITIAELKRRSVHELLQLELKNRVVTLSSDDEDRIVAHCVRSPSTSCPLYIILIAAFLARCSDNEAFDSSISAIATTSNCIQLYRLLIQQIIDYCNSFASNGGDVVAQVLCLVYASHNGISESELLGVMLQPMSNHWSMLCYCLFDWHILTLRSGLLVFAHDQVHQAVAELFIESNGNSDLLKRTSVQLRDYYSQFRRNRVSLIHRVADELPWLCLHLDDKPLLKESILHPYVFVNLYARGHCALLTSYWQHLGADKAKIAQAYMSVAKQEIDSMNETFSPPDVAEVYESIGKYLSDLGYLSEALMLLQRALEIRETCLDPDHPIVAHSLHQLADIHVQQGKLMTAEPLYRQALEIYEGSLGSDHQIVGKELCTLAILYQKQGKREIADPLHKRALTIRQKNSHLMTTSKVAVRPTDNVACNMLQTNIDLASGSNSVEFARSLNEIGVLHYLQNDTSAAELLLKRSLQLREQLLGPSHPDVAQSLYNLAALYYDLKQFSEALPLYERALEIRQKHYPLEHSYVAIVLKNLGILCKKMGLLEKALTYYSSLVESKERCFGANHPSVATAIVNLAVLNSQQGKHDVAEPLYDRALKIFEASPDPFHPQVYETLKNMALLKYEQGDHDTAAQLYKRASDLRCSGGTSSGTIASSTGFHVNNKIDVVSRIPSADSRTSTLCRAQSSACD